MPWTWYDAWLDDIPPDITRITVQDKHTAHAVFGYTDYPNRHKELLRYENGAWHRVDYPSDLPDGAWDPPVPMPGEGEFWRTAFFIDVDCALNGTKTWAVGASVYGEPIVEIDGEYYFDKSLIRGVVLCHDGSSWKTIWIHPDTNLHKWGPETYRYDVAYYERVFVLDDNHLWVAGEVYLEDEDPLSRVVIYYYNGSSWHRQYYEYNNFNYIEGISAVATNKAWAVTRQGDILHYDGSTWSVQLPSGYFPQLSDCFLKTVCAINENDIWVGGQIYDGSTTYVIHYNGVSWELVPIEYTFNPYTIVPEEKITRHWYHQLIAWAEAQPEGETQVFPPWEQFMGMLYDAQVTQNFVITPHLCKDKDNNLWLEGLEEILKKTETGWEMSFNNMFLGTLTLFSHFDMTQLNLMLAQEGAPLFPADAIDSYGYTSGSESRHLEHFSMYDDTFGFSCGGSYDEDLYQGFIMGTHYVPLIPSITGILKEGICVGMLG